LKLFVNPQDWIFDDDFYPDIPLHIGYFVGAGNLEAGRELYAISTLAGHSTPQQTLLSYCHFLDMHQYMAHNTNEGPSDIDLFSRLLNEQPSTIQREINRKAPDCTVQRVLKYRAIRQMSDWIVQLDLATTPLPAIEAVPVEHYSLDSTSILTITDRFDKGHSLVTISTELGIAMPELEGVIGAACKLAGLKTVKGRSRLIAHRRQRKIQTHFLDTTGQHQSERTTISPGKPTDKNEETDAYAILDNLRTLLKDKTTQHNALWFIDYVLNNVTTTKPGVPLHNIADAQRFTTVLKKLVRPSRIYLLHHAANPKFKGADYSVAAAKKVILQQLSINEGAYFYIDTMKAKSADYLGKLQVCLMSKSQNQNCATGKPKAASSLVFACHVAGIGLGARDTG
jgi:hypothetical protein